MATYLQGVTDFIPDYQPFQPDLNFYANLMQTKQNQYDTNWKSLNNLYGQLYGADLTHDLNIKKKDELLKQIDFNLKRVSGLDLSLEQNVNQALQVFKPFYEDQYLTKDMAWTKNWKNTYNAANALKNSKDDKQRKQWWPIGIQGLELRRQMFKDATLDETLNMSNVTYTPLVNAVERYMDLAKKYNVGAVQTLPDKSGLYLVKKKNGDLIMPTLQDMFLAEYAGSADIQEMYREKAFVERMNYAYQNKEKFGSVLESEKDYIKTKIDWLKEYANKKNSEAKDEVETVEYKKAALDKDVENGNLNPQQANYGQSLEELFAVKTAIAEDAKKLNDNLNDDQSDRRETTDQNDIFSDMELARMKVDAGYASVEAEREIMRAANDYAFANAEIEYKANPIGLENLRHSHASQRLAQAASYRKTEQEQKLKDDMYKKAVDFNVAKGIWSFNQDGSLNKNPQVNGYSLFFKTPGSSGTTGSEEYTIDEANALARDRMIIDNASVPTDKLMKMIQNGMDQKQFTGRELAAFIKNFHSTNTLANQLLDKKISPSKETYQKLKAEWDKIYKNYTSNPGAFVKQYAGSGQMYNVNSLMRSWVTKNAGSSLATTYGENGSTWMDFEQLQRSDMALQITQNKNLQNIEAKFRQDLNFIVSKVKAKDPQAYGNVTPQKIEQVVNLVMDKYALQGNGHLGDFKKMAPEIDKTIGAILGFDITKTTKKPTEMHWYNYVVPLTMLGKLDGEESDYETASWVKDVFDNSYEELAKDTNPETGLQTYFSDAMPRSGNRVAFATEQNNIKVAPGVAWDPGNMAASQFFQQVLATNFNQDETKYRITAFGNDKPEDYKADTGITNSEALAIVSEMQARLNTDDKLDPFFLRSSSISMESDKLGSMTLKAPRSVIENVIKSMAGDDVKENDIKKKIDNIYQNGITFIAPTQVWQGNPLFNKAYPTPTEIMLGNGPISYKDPRGNGRYVLEKTPGGSDYRGFIELYEMKPDGTKKTHTRDISLDVKSGKTIGDKEKEAVSMFDQVAPLNFNTFNTIAKGGDPTALQNAQNNFGRPVNNPFWMYDKK
jgi:hypothetical protein